MDRETFIKRLSKCSKESISNYLYNSFKHTQAIHEIELIEYNMKSDKFLNEMNRLNKLSGSIEIKTLDDKIKFMKLHEDWRKTNDELDKLNEWFSSRRESEGK